jgi:hypothetical protein
MNEVILYHFPKGLMLSATESAMCSLEMIPTVSDGRQLRWPAQDNP